MILNNRSLSALPVSIHHPGYDRTTIRAGIAHLGVGNFHRAHQAMYLDHCLADPTQSNWGIIGIGVQDSAAERAKAQSLQAQDGLYTLTTFPPSATPHVRVVGSLIEYMHAPHDTAAVLKILADPSIRIVSMTITEGGYNLNASTNEFLIDAPAVQADLVNSSRPGTVFGLITEALDRRRVTGQAAFTVLSCDNLRHNGDTARHAFLSFARARDRDLARWIEDHVDFPNSMVDRITPSVAEADCARLNAFSGIGDRSPVFAEDFTQWVLEARFRTGRPDLERVGVRFSNEVGAWEQIKLRLLNASHILLACTGLLSGYRTAPEAMRDPALSRLVGDFMRLDAAPYLAIPAGLDLSGYQATLMARFGNPSIADQLTRIASDGAAKIPVFVQDTATAILSAGADHRRLALLLACFSRSLGGMDLAGQPFTVHEPNLSAVDLARLASNPIAVFELKMLGFCAGHAGLHRSVAAYLKAMETSSLRQILESFRDVSS